jgi:hypothetical protein
MTKRKEEKVWKRKKGRRRYRRERKEGEGMEEKERKEKVWKRKKGRSE